jgi:hypothetical protein
MRSIVEGWQLAEMLRAADRSRRDQSPRRFVRAAERALDPELVRAIEHESGIAIAEHLEAVLRAWDGEDADTLGAALRAHVHRLGLPLEVEPAEEDGDHEDVDDEWQDTGEHPHVKRLRGRGTAMLVSGIVLLAVAALLSVLSVALALASVEGRFSGLVCFCAAAVPLGVPGVALLLGGRSRRARARHLRDLEGLALARARLSLEDLCRELETSPSETRALVREALGHGILEGRLDLVEDVFLSALADPRFGERAARCRACGAASAVVRGPGVAPRCPYCGAAMRI